MTVQRVGAILMGADEIVAELVASRIPHMRGKSFGPCTALGVISKETLIGGVVYHGYLGHDVQVSIALDRAAFIPWRALFSYPFEQLGCVRLTAVIGRKNRKSRELCERLGFKLEGVHLKGLDGHQDAISYGMMRYQCRWLKENRHGQIVSRTSAAA